MNLIICHFIYNFEFEWTKLADIEVSHYNYNYLIIAIQYLLFDVGKN